MAMQEFGEFSAQGYIRSAGKCLHDGVDHGIDRVQDSLAARKATPVSSDAVDIEPRTRGNFTSQLRMAIERRDQV